MAEARLAETFGRLNLEDVSVDPSGRIIVTNPEIAAQIETMKAQATARAVPTNGSGCTSNGSRCGRAVE